MRQHRSQRVPLRACPPSPVVALLRLCVRYAGVCGAFPLAGRLPSTASASGFPLLFGRFSGTMQPSDFPSTFVSGVWPPAFPVRPPEPSPEGVDGISRFPCARFPRILRVFDCAGAVAGSRFPPAPVLPSASHNSVGLPDSVISQLNGWSACAPVNASPGPLWGRTHDSGSGWLARPSPVWLFHPLPRTGLPGALYVPETSN